MQAVLRDMSSKQQQEISFDKLEGVLMREEGELMAERVFNDQSGRLETQLLLR